VLVQGAYRGPAVSPLPLRPPSVMGSVLIDLSEQPDHEAMWMLEGMSAARVFTVISRVPHLMV
jgi:hypothetical protein